MTPKEKLKKLQFVFSVLHGVIPDASYGSGPHAKKYAAQLSRIETAQSHLIDMIDELQPVEVKEQNEATETNEEAKPEHAGDSSSSES